MKIRLAKKIMKQKSTWFSKFNQNKYWVHIWAKYPQDGFVCVKKDHRITKVISLTSKKKKV